MRVYWIFQVMIITELYARIGLDELKSLHQLTYTDTEGNTLVINPEGPLNLTRGYIYHKNGYVYNKRLFSHEIDINYALTTENNSSTAYTHKRKKKNDTVHSYTSNKANTDQEYEKLRRYTVDYHNKLIQMFGLNDIYVTIEAGRFDSFIRFMKYPPVKAYSNYILAALLLLSEGVDVPIQCIQSDNDYNLILTDTDVSYEYFTVSLYVPGYNPSNSKYEDILQSEAKSIIEFFIRHRDSSFLKKGRVLAEPVDHNGFKNGNFMDSVQFLIQAYVFEFIDNGTDVEGFITAVFELLNDQLGIKMNKNSSPTNPKKIKKVQAVFDKCFIRLSTGNSGMSRINTLHRIKTIKESACILPFYSAEELPMYSKIPKYNAYTEKCSGEYIKYFTNCCETAVLGLMCCMMYDPYKKEYTTDHLSDPLPELIEFFHMYKVPVESSSMEMLINWNKVVSNKHKSGVMYLSENNEVATGLINALYLITALTMPNADRSTLTEFRNKLDMGHGMTAEFMNQITAYTESVLKTISNNPNLYIRIHDMHRLCRSDGQPDVMCSLYITYEYNSIRTTVCILLYTGHSYFTIITQNDLSYTEYSELCCIRSTYTESDTFIDYTICNYIDTLIRNSGYSGYTPYTSIKDDVLDVINNKYQNMNRLLLVYKIDTVIKSNEIVLACLTLSQNDSMTDTHPMIRFTSNIIGNNSINTVSIRRSVLQGVVYTGTQSLYTKINLPKKVWYNTAIDKEVYINTFYSVIEMGVPEVVINTLYIFIKSENKSKLSQDNPLLIKGLNQKIFLCIFKYNHMGYAHKLAEVLRLYYTPNDRIINTVVFYMWMIYMVMHKPEQTSLIQEIVLLTNGQFFCDMLEYMDTTGLTQESLTCLYRLKESLKDTSVPVDTIDQVSIIIHLCEEIVNNRKA
ncbi:hypothetical protein NEPAR04_1162 [Nematocida parisii]|nr:hypothetical protein NEPAR08_1086 [Nematocida parisii]KAI5128382.1 hypothetical protein NEPAR03_1291 [Nematocida parisii]KAI5141690.1 hypothetical protein NEPAR04_1162 [Nematocida parisii]